MEFDKSRVYTVLNADELKVGSKVIVADSLSTLKARVEHLKTKEDEENVIVTIIEIRDEYYQQRFIDNEGHDAWNLVYLISEPEEKKLKWTDLKLGDILKCKTETRMVTGIDTSDESDGDGNVCHIYAGGWWSTDKELEEWEKVE